MTKNNVKVEKITLSQGRTTVIKVGGQEVAITPVKLRGNRASLRVKCSEGVTVSHLDDDDEPYNGESYNNDDNNG